MQVAPRWVELIADWKMSMVTIWIFYTFIKVFFMGRNSDRHYGSRIVNRLFGWYCWPTKTWAWKTNIFPAELNKSIVTTCCHNYSVLSDPIWPFFLVVIYEVITSSWFLLFCDVATLLLLFGVQTKGNRGNRLLCVGRNTLSLYYRFLNYKWSEFGGVLNIPNIRESKC